MGSGKVEITDDEKKSRDIMRRKIVASKNINKGDILSLNNVSFKRSILGIDVGEWDKVEGCEVSQPISSNSGITKDKIIQNKDKD